MSPVITWGILLPDASLRTEFMGVLMAFVALNTVLYVTLALAKLLPKIYLSDFLPGRDRRTETRGIHPDDPI